ncbi:hypothetical protein GCM10011490_16190 [Pseudoclavibacter endophyticus]|nr:hypothetical protein GCM10011490_16190 [Pseudoclavibacter endophyticus]
MKRSLAKYVAKTKVTTMACHAELPISHMTQARVRRRSSFRVSVADPSTVVSSPRSLVLVPDVPEAVELMRRILGTRGDAPVSYVRRPRAARASAFSAPQQIPDWRNLGRH